MKKIITSISDQLALRMRAVIPEREKNKIITRLIELEIKRREKALFECATAVEKDTALQKEMQDWDITQLGHSL